MDSTFGKLLARMQELKDLSGIIGLASWDQETYLPRKAEDARAAQLSTLQGLYHERLVEPQVAQWLEEAKPSSADQTAMLRVFRHERDRASKVPSRLVKAIAEAQSHGLSAWREARAAKDFAPFLPKLEHLVALRREQADAFGHGGERYDALLEGFEPGMTVARLSPVLDDLTAKLVPIVDALARAAQPRDVFAGHTFPVDTQWALTLEVLGVMGFDLEAGRQDKSTHPFTGGTHPTDVRLTVRLFDTLPLSSLYSAIHEGGHGLYEQGFAPADYRTPLAQAPSMGLHESQSRMWENQVGRSVAFWTWFQPRFVAAFPKQLLDVSFDALLRTVNRVEKTFIRVEADEVTYNLHIALRYQLELQLLRGTLAVKDLPEAWNALTQKLFGLVPPTPNEGVLQDIHWAWGEFGYFPTYALGNLYAAQLFDAAQRALPSLEGDLAHGQFSGLREWLRAQVHQQGFRQDAEALVKQVTGTGLSDVAFIAYLKGKYGPLYGVAL